MGTGSDTASLPRRLGWVVLFSIAMGLLEAIVVVYLRELYFPGGFRFPLRSMPQQMVGLEILREASTIVMLAAVAAMSARPLLLRFSAFLIAFGVWDIFYYVFLKVLLDWPESPFTWDVLFLIPITWLGPVLAPLVCSVVMIIFGLLLTGLHRRYGTVHAGWMSWTLLATGAFAVFFTFIADSLSILSQKEQIWDAAAFQAAMEKYIPGNYHWTVFLAGQLMITASAVLVYRNTVFGARCTDGRNTQS